MTEKSALSRRYFMRIYEDRARAYEAAKKVTDFVTGRSWVMSEFGPDSYQFTHRTFMEYFFARHLDERNETVLELLDALLPHVKERQWDVISHLALQMKTFRNQKRTAQAIETLKTKVDASISQETSLVEVASFFANALAYLIPSEMNCKVAVLELVRAAFWVVERGDAEAPANIIRSLCTCVIERREYVQRVIVDALEKRLSDAEVGPSLLFCVMLLSDQTKIAPFGTNSSLPFAKRYERECNSERKRTYTGAQSWMHPARTYIQNGTTMHLTICTRSTELPCF